MKGLLFRVVFLTIALVSLFFTIACPNGDSLADSIFKKLGLNRIRVVTTKIKPGGVILTKNGKVYYIGQMSEYAGATPPAFTNGEDDAIIAATNANASTGASIVLSKPKTNTNTALASNVDTTIASPTDLGSFIPVKADGKIDFSASANFDQIEAKNFSIPMAQLSEYVYDAARPKSFFNEMRRYAKKGYKIYVIYEAFASKKLKLTTRSGKEIGANVNVNQIVELGAGFSYTKTSNSSLDFDGNTYFTFAVRTVQLKYKNDSFTLEPGEYKGTGLGVGGDIQFSYSPLTDAANEFPPIEEVIFEKPSLDN